MANSGPVASGDQATAAQYNNLRADVLDPALGHDHTGAADHGVALPASRGIYGDGSDGNVTISGNTTLTRTMFYDNLTVNAGVVLNCNGYRIFVKGTLTNRGTIAWPANPGGNSPGISGSTIAVAGGGATNTLGGGAGGGYGGGSGAGQNGPASNYGYGGAGGAGGAGAGGIAGLGGAVPIALPGAQYWYPRTFPLALIAGLASGVNLGFTMLNGGSGGGGGGGSATGNGGGGGAGGNCVMVIARLLDNAGGVIHADGGAGGYATGNGGGGGGGGGGWLLLAYDSIIAGTERAAGGAGGAKSGTGMAGNAGPVGAVHRYVA